MCLKHKLKRMVKNYSPSKNNLNKNSNKAVLVAKKATITNILAYSKALNIYKTNGNDTLQVILN
jgi:hypothetical protein